MNKYEQLRNEFAKEIYDFVQKIDNNEINKFFGKDRTRKQIIHEIEKGLIRYELARHELQQIKEE